MASYSSEELLIHANRLALAMGAPGLSLADFVASEKVVDLASARRRLRPPEPRSLMSTLQNIEAVRSAARAKPDDSNG